MSITGGILECARGLDPMILLLGLWLLYTYRLLRKKSKSRDNPIDLDDLLLDENRRLSRRACAFVGAFLFSLWLQAWLTMHDKMAVEYFIAFLTAFVTPVVAKIIWPNQQQAPAPTVQDPKQVPQAE